MILGCNEAMPLALCISLSMVIIKKYWMTLQLSALFVVTALCVYCLLCAWQTRFIFKHYHLCVCTVKSYKWLLWRQPVLPHGRYALKFCLLFSQSRVSSWLQQVPPFLMHMLVSKCRAQKLSTSLSWVEYSDSSSSSIDAEFLWWVLITELHFKEVAQLKNGRLWLW